ncbi:hypothetical protein ACNJ7E_26425 [Rhodococcus sp. NM-2]|uniref:hypothetical protein n=1 Tax=Rhodococcus sp. NM-2 TaxID=3401174 RepID=UPI003AACDAD0
MAPTVENIGLALKVDEQDQDIKVRKVCSPLPSNERSRDAMYGINRRIPQWGSRYREAVSKNHSPE